MQKFKATNPKEFFQIVLENSGSPILHRSYKANLEFFRTRTDFVPLIDLEVNQATGSVGLLLGSDLYEDSSLPSNQIVVDYKTNQIVIEF